MGDVLRGAAALCALKVACSSASVPALGAPRSPVGLCCCCLLIFTDLLVAVSLSSLYVFRSWLPELPGDVIALRFLLFLSHVYGGVLLLITPLMAADTLYRLLGPAAGSDGRRRAGVAAAERQQEEESEDADADAEQWLFHAVCYLGCLAAWVFVALNVRWRWRLEEVWSASCVHATGSLIGCLPRLLPPGPVDADPCRGTVSLLLIPLLLFLPPLLLTMNARMHGRRRVPGGLAPVGPASSASAPAPFVDPGKTQSSCALHAQHWRSSVQMPTRHHGDRPEHRRTKGGATRGDPRHVISRCGRGFPRRGARAMLGPVVALSVVVLPPNLSVNVLAIRTVETLLELTVRGLVSLAANATETPAVRDTTLV
ncbi:uncharacterized protein LOC129604079 [Betta splendens]|uniref:Uncharacterized protein LOC129604079 n=1 Tax=Betta splendens TaxID=158456 RepID=A0A9W2XSX0_BETSP|nr:uncharacterized protein LOC129604079 [Betta splendens]XP_055364700.1 uncharacterized protein LOC129604079 [Betta splendens]